VSRPGVAARHDADLGVVKHVAIMMKPRQQEAPLQVLQSPQKPNAAPRCILIRRTGDSLRKHGPSLGKTPDPSSDLEPIFVTGSRTSSEKGRSIELHRQAPAIP
jgi:hypothetical protein